jgi:YegS/Rv2252/BmrU family lipid kinase
MAAPVCLIVNPSAGGGRAGRLAPQVQQQLAEHGLDVRRVETRDLEHARDLAREAARNGEAVVALGGDGLAGVLADELRGIPGATLGVLPGGRGNDLARVLGISDDALLACTTIAGGAPRAMDLGEVVAGGSEGRGQAFVGIASAGFDSEANRIANAAPAWMGGMAYTYGALRALASWRPARFEIELDPPGERRAFLGYSIGVANSKAYGGGMLAAPDALLDDGMLDIVLVEHMSRARFLASVLPRVFKGTHVQLQQVRVFRAAEVTISADRPFTMYADGDPIGTLPLRLRALPAAVTVLTPDQNRAGSAFTPSPTPSSAPLSSDRQDAAPTPMANESSAGA